MYEENIRNLIGQRERERMHVLMSQQTSQNTLKKRNMNQPFKKSIGVNLSTKQKAKVDSVTKFYQILKKSF